MKLFILCGIPGCGKSTWAQNYMLTHQRDCRYVSRDAIRFSMLGSADDYFNCEDKVFQQFIYSIVDGLENGLNVIADATHLNMTSRRKLTSAIDKYFTNYEIVYVCFNVDVSTCIERNEKRSGRAKVPDSVIHSMAARFRVPRQNEDPRQIDTIMVSWM